MLKKYFLLILSHSKSVHRTSQIENLREQKDFDKFITYYFIGIKDLKTEYQIDEKNKIVYLKIPDNYESLSLKTLKAINFINKEYKDSIKGVFKTDDDIDLNLHLLYKSLEENSEEKYFGNKTTNIEPQSSYHYGKCENPTFNNLPLSVPKNTDYCSGGGYFLHHSVLEDILKNDEPFYKIIFEDIAMGKCMKDLGYYPKHFDLKEFCKWESDNHFDLDFDMSNFPENCILSLVLSDENGSFNSPSIKTIGSNIKPPLRIRMPAHIKLSPDGPYKLKIVATI